MDYTKKQLAILEEKQNEPVQFEITTTQVLEFSIFGLKNEINRVQSDLELSIQRQANLTARKIQLEEKLEEVKQRILTT